ncbi:MAG: peptidylprolyl isomerase [Gallionella sp.]
MGTANILMAIVALTVLTPAYALDLSTADSAGGKSSGKTPTVASQDPQQVETIDSVAAIVNDDVITRFELDDRMRDVEIQLKKQGTALPPSNVLERQLLERMITEMLQLQYAKESGVRVDDTQLDQAIERIAEQNNFASAEEFRNKLESEDVDYKKFREEIRSEIIATRLREREVESKLVVSDTEVDNYLANKAKAGGSEEEYHLAHILVVVPEQASAEKIQAARERAEQALKQLDGGADFAQVAAGNSDAKDALTGGDLGWRTSESIPNLFMSELQSLQRGKTTGVLRSPSGFHILKLVEKRSGKAAVVITQTHARHILIKTSELMSEKEARTRLTEIKKRIDDGAEFADQAKRYSQDGSAQRGGDLDWLSPGQTVPEFEEAMNKLAPGAIGEIKTQFGWHLIQVLERRSTDISEQQRRQQARVAIGTFKSDEQYQDWLRQLRDRAFIEYRLPQNE